MSRFSKIFFRGLITLLPIAVTIYIIYSAVIILENLPVQFSEEFFRTIFLASDFCWFWR
jgi:uncharacterized membrane protein